MKSKDSKLGMTRRKVLGTATAGSLGLALTAESRPVQNQPERESGLDHGSGIDVLVMKGDVQNWRDFLQKLIDNGDNYYDDIKSGNKNVNEALGEFDIYFSPEIPYPSPAGDFPLPPIGKMRAVAMKLDQDRFHISLLFDAISGGFRD